MNKTIRKAVTTRSRLRKKILKNKTQSNESTYKKQIILYVALFRKEKKLNTKNIIDHKKFCKTVFCKSFLANEISSKRDKITLTQKYKIISRSKGVAEIFNAFFANVVNNLDILLSMKVFLVAQQK